MDIPNYSPLPFDPKVLIVDDAPFHRAFVAKALSGLPAWLSYAREGREAIEIAIAERPALILMDRVMPVMDGRTAALAIRRRPELKATQILCVSANLDPALLCDGTFNGHVEKPIQADALRALVAERLGITSWLRRAG